MKQLDEFGVPYEVKVASAHRKPAEVHEWASTAVDRGIRVIVAAAGKGGTHHRFASPERISVQICGVKERDASVDGSVDHGIGTRLLLRCRSGATKVIAAESHRGDDKI